MSKIRFARAVVAVSINYPWQCVTFDLHGPLWVFFFFSWQYNECFARVVSTISTISALLEIYSKVGYQVAVDTAPSRNHLVLRDFFEK